MVQISRRAFLQLTAASALAVSTTSLVACATTEVLSTDPAPVPPEFGFTFNDEIYQTGFASRNMAIEAARGEALASMRKFRVAQIMRPAFAIPDDLTTTAVDWLINPGQLGNVLAQAVVDENEDLDFEGELEDACFGIERASLGAEGREAIAAALARHGAADLAYQVRRDTLSPHLDPTEQQDKLLDALIADRRLEADLWDAVQRWVIQYDLAEAGNGLKVLDVEEYDPPETFEVALSPPGQGRNVQVEDHQGSLL